MAHKVFESCWVHGNHRIRSHDSVHSAVRAIAKAELAGEQGMSRVVIGLSHEDIGRELMSHDEIHEAVSAYGAAHGPSRSPSGMRRWQKVCSQIRKIQASL